MYDNYVYYELCNSFFNINCLRNVIQKQGCAKGAKASEQQPNAWHHRKNFHQNQTKAQNKPKKARAQPILTHHQVPLLCLRWLSYKQ